MMSCYVGIALDDSTVLGPDSKNVDFLINCTLEVSLKFLFNN